MPVHSIPSLPINISYPIAPLCTSPKHAKLATNNITVILPIKFGITLNVRIGMRIIVVIAAARAGRGDFSPLSRGDRECEECVRCEASFSEEESIDEEAS
jgi:hypothetical protein